jgi:hypothetical protein
MGSREAVCSWLKRFVWASRARFKATPSRAAHSAAAAIASFLVFGALFYAVWLVGFTIRIGLYGVYLERRRQQREH